MHAPGQKPTDRSVFPERAAKSWFYETSQTSQIHRKPLERFAFCVKSV
jgi:hypothetical protein